MNVLLITAALSLGGGCECPNCQNSACVQSRCECGKAVSVEWEGAVYRKPAKTKAGPKNYKEFLEAVKNAKEGEVFYCAIDCDFEGRIRFNSKDEGWGEAFGAGLWKCYNSKAGPKMELHQAKISSSTPLTNPGLTLYNYNSSCPSCRQR